MWSVWQPDRNLFFNSFFIAGQSENLVVDPLPLTAADAAEIEGWGGIGWIAVTNRDHERDARAVAARFGAKLAAGAADVASLTAPVDRALSDGDELCGASVMALDGLKTPGEFALWWEPARAVLVGDALWGDPAGSVRLMPDEKLANPARAVRSLRTLCALWPAPDHLLVGDGTCVFGNAVATMRTALEARRDVYANAINADELHWRHWKDEPANFGGQTAEIGRLIGAEKLGYHLVRLEPGQAFCPQHSHSTEEELFVMMHGTATLRTPRGAIAVRAGDYIAFPTGARGAHKLENTSSKRCEVLMLANIESVEVCYYPDSSKVAVLDDRERRKIMLRDHPSLDYFDGE